jgi:hypothetical protein
MEALLYTLNGYGYEDELNKELNEIVAPKDVL